MELLSLLQARRDWSGAELSDRLVVSRRTIRRDVERLRGLGYPVESLTGPAGGYRLRAGTAMPPLLLDDDEAIAIAVGLGTAARASVTGIEETAVRALVKLEQVLPAHLRRRVSALGSATIAPPVAGPTVDPQHLTVIAAACRDRESLRFAYRSRDGTDSRREVEPHSLVNLGRRWYLVAWDRRRDDWRTFRIDRLSTAGLERRPLHPAQAASQGCGDLRRAEHHRSADTATRPTSPCTRPPRRSRIACLTTGGRSSRSTSGRCGSERATTTLDGWRYASRCSTSSFEVHEPPELAERLRRARRQAHTSHCWRRRLARSGSIRRP